MKVLSKPLGNKGVVAIVAAILSLTLFAFAVTTYLLTAIPSQVKEREYEHSEELSEAFVHLAKSLRDIRVGETRTITFPLSEPPLLLKRSPYACSISVKENEGENRTGFVMLQDWNSEYPNQSFIFEEGGVIRSEGGAYEMECDPPMIVPLGRAGENVRIMLQDYRIVRVTKNRSRSASTGFLTLQVSAVREYFRVAPADENTGNGWQRTIDFIPDDVHPPGEIEIALDSKAETAWRGYLERLRTELTQQYPELRVYAQPLDLILRIERPNGNLVFWHKVVELEVSIW
jgi:hypothetical protein